MPPSLVLDEAEEAAYIGLCTFIVTVISLSPQASVSDAKLMSYLARVNADDHMPTGKRDDVLAKMARQGYIFKVTERNEDNETVDWRVGPRGKIEIGNKGIQGLVNEVYGEAPPEDLEKRLRRSLRLEVVRAADSDEDAEEEPHPDEDAEPTRQTSGKRRRVTAEE